MRLFDFLVDFVEAQHVAFAMPHLAIERAEVAAGHAHVGVVDVAIDDVGDDVLGMLAAAYTVGHPAQPVGGGMTIKLQRLVWGQTAARFNSLLERLEVHRLGIEIQRFERRCQAEVDGQFVKAP